MGATQDSPADYPVVQLRSLANGQSLFLSTTNWSASSFTSLPVPAFPTGYALLTVFVNGIPSASSFLIIGNGAASAPVTLVAPAVVSGGTFKFNFTSTPGSSFTILSAANPNQPVGNWTVLGSATEVSPGQYQFSNTPPANTPQQFYRVRSP